MPLLQWYCNVDFTNVGSPMSLGFRAPAATQSSYSHARSRRTRFPTRTLQTMRIRNSFRRGSISAGCALPVGLTRRPERRHGINEAVWLLLCSEDLPSKLLDAEDSAQPHWKQLRIPELRKSASVAQDHAGDRQVLSETSLQRRSRRTWAPRCTDEVFGRQGHTGGDKALVAKFEPHSS